MFTKFREQLVTSRKTEANIYELKFVVSHIGLDSGFLEMLSNENVCFLPWHVLFHEQRGRASYNKTDLGHNDLMRSQLGCFPSHLGVRTGSACGGPRQEVLCLSWEGRADPHGQDITLLPLPDCVSQSSHGHCSASCRGKPWLLSVHLPRPANWRQQRVRCCRESGASSLRTDPVSTVAGT